MGKRAIDAIALIGGAFVYSALRLFVFHKGGLIPVGIAAAVYTAATFGLQALFLEKEAEPQEEAK